MSLLNSPIEISLRLLVLLDERHPEQFSLTQLIMLDHALVHSGDLGGPPSAHLDIPGRATEVAVQRKLVQDALSILIRTNLAEAMPNKDGVMYAAGPRSSGFLRLFNSQYLGILKEKSKWANDWIRDKDDQALRTVMTEVMNSWSVEALDGS